MISKSGSDPLSLNRNKCRDLLYTAMRKRKVEESEIKVNVYHVAGQIEAVIFNEMRGTNMKYKNRCESAIRFYFPLPSQFPSPLLIPLTN